MNSFRTSICVVLNVVSIYHAMALPFDDENDYSVYLKTFGYLEDKASNVQRSSRGPSSLTRAIRQFQAFNGLAESGVLDDVTRTKMKSPRCGVSDRRPIGAQSEGAAYFWKKRRLTWALVNSSPKLDDGKIRRLLSDAFGAWASAVPLEFIEAGSGASADIRVSFGRRSHGDAWPFDGISGVLAHAMYPSDGRVHFDEAEPWTLDHDVAMKNWRRVDFLTVAVHELGHTLGLFHSSDSSAIMAPFYQNFEKPTKLQPDDRRRIQEIYGTRNVGVRPQLTTTAGPTTRQTTRTTTSATTSTTRRFIPRRRKRTRLGSQCPISVDSAIAELDGSVLLFSGASLFRRRSRGVPTSIDSEFPDAPPSVTAALRNERSGTTLLFHERQVFAYDHSGSSARLRSGFPKLLSPKVPFTPAGAFIHTDGNQILFAGRRFVVYDENWNVPTMSAGLDAYFPFIPPGTGAVARITDEAFLLFGGARVHTFSRGAKRKTHPIRLQEYLRC